MILADVRASHCDMSDIWYLAPATSKRQHVLAGVASNGWLVKMIPHQRQSGTYSCVPVQGVGQTENISFHGFENSS